MSNSYIDMVKGFHRVGSFPAFDDENYSSFSEAAEYARNGAFGGTATPGQILRVLDALTNDVKVYVINNAYKLVPIADPMADGKHLVLKFNHDTPSGLLYIELPKDFVLNTITIKINEVFPKGSKMQICSRPSDANPDYPFETIISPDELIIDELEMDYNDTYPSGSEFIFNLTTSLNVKTRFYILLNVITPEDGSAITGSGIMKIN